jgi:hypothetical protein
MNHNRGGNFLLATILALASGPLARAHDPGLSSVTVRVKATTIEAELAFAIADAENLGALDANQDGQDIASGVRANARAAG